MTRELSPAPGARRRRTVRRGVALTVVVTVGALASAPLAEAASTSTRSRSFACSNVNGGRHPFTVPAGVTTLHVQVVGAMGQARSGTSGAGAGGTITADVPAVPGHLLNVWAGCSGKLGGVGFGSGGDHGVASAYDAQDGGFGGGGSAIYDDTADTFVVVAGGGGGSGGNSGGDGIEGIGGKGGNGGLTPQAGGVGGVGPFGTGFGPSGGCGGCAGTGQLDGLGGGNSSAPSASGGGGGGGGGYAGGGGGSGSDHLGSFEGGGGGGGGQSYVTPAATNVSEGTNTSSASGSVVITWPRQRLFAH